jgi:hypothetical protein
MSTLSEIRTDVQANWPDNYHSSDLDNDKTDEFINKTLRKIQRIYNFTWMKQEVTRSTVDATRKYSVPTAGDSNWSEVESGTVRKHKDEITTELINAENTRVELRKRTKKQIEDDPDFSDLDDAGTPSDYCIDQLYLWLYHKPDHAYNNDSAWTINMQQYGYLPDLSGDSDTNTVTNDYPEVLEYGATAQGFRFGHDIEMAEYWEAKMNEVLAEMINADIGKELSTVESGIEPELGAGIGDIED